MADHRLPAAAVAALAALWGCAGSVPEEAGGTAEPPVEVRASVDRAVATTGDLITYRIVVDHDPSVEIALPDAGSEIAGFRIVDIGEEEPREEGGRQVLERWYQLRADLVGSYVLPAVEVSFRPADAGPETPVETVAASRIFVEVESVLPADGEITDIRDIKPLREIERDRPWRWIALGSLLLALAAWGFYLWWRRRGEVEWAATPPHEAAFRALDELRALDLADPAQIRRFYFGLSEALRGYVEGRFGLNATDLTTEEIRERLIEVAGLAPEPRGAFERFLQDTDQVKFAHYQPEPREIEAIWERALGFVEVTRPAEEAA